jgi:hypothetical protein
MEQSTRCPQGPAGRGQPLSPSELCPAATPSRDAPSWDPEARKLGDTIVS